MPLFTLKEKKMKSTYETPKISIIALSVNDVISASLPDPDIPKNEDGDDLEWD